MRLLDIDGPEMFHLCCARECEIGAAAAARLSAMLAAGPIQLADSSQRDKHMRPFERVSVNCEDVGQVLLREGLACDGGSGLLPEWSVAGVGALATRTEAGGICVS